MSEIDSNPQFKALTLVQSVLRTRVRWCTCTCFGAHFLFSQREGILKRENTFKGATPNKFNAWKRHNAKNLSSCKTLIRRCFFRIFCLSTRMKPHIKLYIYSIIYFANARWVFSRRVYSLICFKKEIKVTWYVRIIFKCVKLYAFW